VISPQIKFKKKWLDNKGVSEIIGTILMLAITVVLFSSIMVFVTNMPTPIMRPTADFLSSVTFTTTPTTSGTVTLTHNGGEALNDYETQLLVIVNNNVLPAPRTMAEGGLGSTWKIGQKWTYTISGLESTNSLEIMVIDLHSNSQVWDGKISAGAGNNAPVILQRWTDSDTSTLTADPIIEGDVGFSLFVRVTDADNNLLNVTVDASSIGSGSNKGNYSINGGVWEFKFTNSITQASLFDGRPLLIKAKDRSVPAHWANATFLLTVSASERGPTGDPGATGTTGPQGPAGNQNDLGSSGLPNWLKFINEDQGYVVLGEDIASRAYVCRNGVGWPGNVSTTAPKTSFYLGQEWVFVRVGSLKLTNVYAKNNLTIVNHLSGQTITNPNAFTVLPQTGNAFLYEARFNSSSFMSTGLAPGGYDLIIDLLSSGSGSSPARLYAKTNVSIYPPGQPNFFIPSFELYDMNRTSTNKLPTAASVWGSLTHPYDLSNISAAVIWVEIQMLDVGNKNLAGISDLRITDMKGRTNLYGDPPSGNGMITPINSETSNKTYRFSIDLRLRNGIVWSSGLSAYSLTITRVSDQNEGIYTLSTPVWIKAAVQTKNYITATNGFGFSGSANSFAHFDYLFQTENNKFFSTRILEGKDLSPGSGAGARIFKVLYFDMDGDGDRDALVSMSDYTTYKLAVYVNRLNEIGMWEPKSLLDYNTADGQALSMAYGDVDGNGINDWVVATYSGKVYLYVNEFPIVKRELFSGSSYYFAKMKLTDITGDGRADLIAMGSTSYTKLLPGDSTCQLRMWNLTRGSSIAGTPYPLTSPGTTYIYDFDVGNINTDGMPDIALVSADNAKGAEWFQWTPNAAVDAHALAPSIANGVAVSGNFTDTATEETPSPVYEVISEQNDANDRLNVTWQVGGPVLPIIAGSNPVLYVDAKVGAASSEGFYFYYSKSAGGPYTFMFLVPSTQVTNATYRFPLPIDVSGSIWIRALDADLSSSPTHDSIYVNWIAVKGTSSIGWTEKPLTSTDNTFTCIGIGNADNIGWSDVFLGKNGIINIITIKSDGTKLTELGSAVTYTHLLEGYTGSFASRYNGEYVQDLFQVKDVNGDGLTDIIAVVNGGSDNMPVMVSEWLNLGGSSPSFSRITVLDITPLFGTSCGSETNNDNARVTCIAVENMYGT